MGWTGILYWLLLRRLRSSWALLSITAFGILAAVTLMSVGAVYSQVLAEGGLQHTLATIDQRVLNVQVITQNRPLGPADYQRLRTHVEQISEARLGHLIRGVERLGQTQGDLPIIYTNDGRAPTGASPMGRPFFLTGFQDHSRIVEGRWPETAPVLHENGLDMEIAIGAQTARSIGLKTGTQIFLVPFSSELSEIISLTIVGLVEPLDSREEYWMFSPSYFSVQQFGEDVLLPLYVPEEHFFSGMGAKYPSLVGDFAWFIFLDAAGLTADTAGPAKDALVGLETDINKQFPRTLVLTGLKNRILAYERTLILARIPLFLFISLVVVVILYFLALIMGLIARSQADEAGLLRSRGAGVLQVTGLLVLGEGILVLVAVAVGPFLALALVRYLLLGTINPELGDTGSITVGISASMFWMGAIGGLLSLGVLIVSGWSRARNGMIESLAARARPPTVPFVHRYYLDVLVLVALALVMWQIRGRGGFATQDLASNSLDVDYTLLLGPILGLIGAAVITLRVLPWVVRVFAWLSVRAGPAWIAFPLVRLARDPLPHGSLVVILLLATALGLFGAAFQASLSKSQIEQALYRVGGEVVLTGQSFSEALQRDIASIYGVSSVTPIFKQQVSLVSLGSSTRTVLLAADPVTLPNTVWFRDDFSEVELEELLSPLHQARYIASTSSADPGLGIEIPGDSEYLGVWVKPSVLTHSTVVRELNLWARVEGSGGKNRHLLMGDLLESQTDPVDSNFMGFQRPADTVSPSSQTEIDWRYYQVSLEDAVGSMEPPIRLVAFFMSRAAFTRLPPGSIRLDDITAIGPRDGDTVGDTVNDAVGGTVIEGFEGSAPWVVLPNQGTVPDTLERSAEAARSGDRGLTFSWEEPFSGLPRGIMIPPGPHPLPVIAGPTFQVGQSLRPKVNGQIVPMTVTGLVSYFPTVNPTTQPLLIASLEDLRQYLRRTPRGRYSPPQTLWLALDPGADRESVIEAVDNRLGRAAIIKDRVKQVDLARRDPLAGGGWNGLTLIGMAAISVAVLLTLALHGVAEVRTGRVDLTVAQTMGLSRLQLTASLALERVVVAVLGIGVGAVVGLWMGRWVLGYLDITPTGRPVIPPMIPIVEEWVAVLVLTGLAAATLLAFVFVAVAARRLRIPEILRMGE